MKTKECHIWYQCFCFQWVYEDERVPYTVSMFLFSMGLWRRRSAIYGINVSVFNGSMKTKECHIWYQCFCFQWVYEDEGVPYMVSMFLFSMGL